MSYRSLILTIIFLLLPIVFLLRLQQKPKIVQAEWFNDSWTYRQAINISSHTATESNVYISAIINISSTTKSQADNGDFRFIDQSGKTLSYYRSSGVGTTNITFNILLPTFNSGASTIYAYYGNPSSDNGYSDSTFSTQATGYTIGSYSAEETGGGPIAYWKFDEGVGATINDSTSNQNKGSIYGSTWQSENECINGKCLYFDGVNDYIDIGNKSNITTDAWTIVTWVKPSNRSAMPLMTWSNTNANSPSLLLQLSTTGQPIIYMGSNNYKYFSSDSWSRLVDGNWHQVVFTINGSANSDIITSQMYIDGILQGSGISITSSGAQTTKNDFEIGKGAYAFFKGFMDEFKVFNYVRSSSQIKQDYLASAPKGAAVQMGSSSPKSLSDGLVGYWKMDEGTGTTTLDSSGNNYTGTLNSTGWSTGKYGIGTSFNGSSGYVQATSPNFSVLTSQFSLSTWVKPTTLSGRKTLIVHNGGWGIITNGTNAALYYGSNQSGDLISTTSLTVNQWNHVVGVFDNGIGRIYVNGILDKTGNPTTTTNTSGSSPTIGGINQTGYTTDGLIDEARIYNRVLSASEVTQLYQYAPGPIAEWKMDEGNGSTIYDTSGIGNTGILGTGSSAPSWAIGKIGKALKFNGTNNYVDIGNPPSLTNTTVKTISFWTKLIGQTGVDSAGSHFINKDNKWFIATEPSNNRNIFGHNFSGTAGRWSFPLISTDTWHFVTVVYDRGSTANDPAIYVDNIPQTVAEYMTPIGSASDDSSTNLYLSYSSGNGRWLNGYLDQVRIYNYARTQKQILEDMGSGQPANKSPIIHYKFDEGQGTAINNSGIGGSTFNGTLTNAASPATSTSGWTKTGKIGTGLNFDGTNDYVTKGHDPILNLTTDLTMSAWFKTADVGNDRVLVGKNANGDYLYSIFKTTDDLLHCKIYATAGGVGYLEATIANTNDNNWHHTVCTVKDNTLNFYLDGVLKSTDTTTTGTRKTTSSAPLYIGAFFNLNAPWSGSIDEVKIYNYALTADEAKQDYNRGASVQFGSTNQAIGSTITSLDYCLPGDTSYCSPPLAEWKMDEGNGSVIYDTSGTGNTGAFGSGSSAPNWSVGKIGKALSFDGNNDYVYIKNSSLITGLSGFTIGSWINVSPGTTGFRNIYAETDANSGSWVNFGVRTDNTLILYMYTSSGQSAVSTSTIQAGWNYVAGTFSSTNGMKVYINNILSGTGTNTTNNSRNTEAILGATYLYQGSGAKASHFSGLIDQVRVYNYARTPAQIAYDYNRGGPVGHWKLDECQGNISYDSSGIGNTGSINIGSGGSQNSLGTCQVGTSAAWTNGAIGKWNSSLNFDGTDDYVLIGGSHPSLQITGDITISSWVKTTKANYQVTIDDLGSNPYTSWCQWLDPNGRIVWYDGGTWRASQGSVNNGQWHHIVTRVSNNNLTYYIDGQLDPNSYSSISARTATSDNKRLGTRADAIGYPFQGQLDDVRVYNYALTSEQIKQLYNGGSVSFR